MKCIMETDYSKRDWTELIKKAEEEISKMYPWDVISSYVDIMNRIMNIEDEAFASVVEAGEFYIRDGSMAGLDFNMPAKVPMANLTHRLVTILMEDRIPGTDDWYGKELKVPYRVCGRDGFDALIKAEIPKRAEIILKGLDFDVGRYLTPDQKLRTRVRRVIESGELLNKIKANLTEEIPDRKDLYHISKVFKSAMEKALKEYPVDYRRLISYGRFEYVVLDDNDFCLNGFNFYMESDAKVNMESLFDKSRVKFTLVVKYGLTKESVTVTADTRD